MESEEQSKTGVIYRINLPDNKIYIGRTTRPIEERLYQHAYEATSKKKQQHRDVELPFISPYKNYKGKNSSIRRLESCHKKSIYLMNLPLRERRRWLTQELLKRTEILEEVELIGSSVGRVFETLSTGWNKGNPLAVAEHKYIQEAWIENPRQLLNYDALPFHSEMRFELFRTLNESIEKLGNFRYEYDKGRYCLSWGYEWSYITDSRWGHLTDYQQTMLEQAEKRIYDERLEWYNSLSTEGKEREDACEYSSHFYFSDEEVALEVLNKLLPIDKESVINKRGSPFNKKKAAIAKELKRISELSMEERKKLVAGSLTN